MRGKNPNWLLGVFISTTYILGGMVMKREKILISIVIVCLLLSIMKICSDTNQLDSNIGNILSSFVLIIIAGAWFGFPVRLLYKLYIYKAMKIFCSVVLTIFFLCQTLCCLLTIIQVDYENYYIGQCISSGIFIGILFARRIAYKRLGYILEKKKEL